MPTEFLTSVETIISRRGWACQGVFACIDDDGPEWVYTIGHEDRGWPEFIIVGLSPEPGAAVLNQLSLDILAGIRPVPRAGDTIYGLPTNGHPVRVVDVHPDLVKAGQWFSIALARRGSNEGLAAVQLVWPHLAGDWPDVTTDLQPLLGDPWWTG